MTAPYPTTALEPEVISPLILALPKGRILAECGALLARAGVAPAPDYTDEEAAGCASRQMIRHSMWCASGLSTSPRSLRSAPPSLASAARTC